MKKILIIGAGEFQNPLIIKAKEMGYETHVFAWKSGDIGEETADYFYPISIVEKEKILEEGRKIKPDAVVSIGSDLATITVNYVARGLGLIANPQENDYCSTNKYLMRKTMKEAGVATPEFICVDDTDDLDAISCKIEFPAIVKPTDRSGSRAVSKVENAAELAIAVKNAVQESFEKKAIIENVIEGEEYSCECISFEGRHYFLAFTKKYTTDAPHYIETGHIQPAKIPENVQKKIKKEIFTALDALHVQYGASHSEFRLDRSGNMRIIEIGARMGGDCIGSDLVQLSTGNDYIKMVIDCATGKKPQINEPDNKIAVIRFIFNSDDRDILEKITQWKGVSCVRKEIKEITDKCVTDSSNRYGFYIFECDTYEIAEMLINKK